MLPRGSARRMKATIKGKLRSTLIRASRPLAAARKIGWHHRFVRVRRMVAVGGSSGDGEEEESSDAGLPFLEWAREEEQQALPHGQLLLAHAVLRRPDMVARDAVARGVQSNQMRKWTKAAKKRKEEMCGMRFELLIDPDLDGTVRGAVTGSPVHQWSRMRFEFEASSAEENARWTAVLAPLCRRVVGFFGGELDNLSPPRRSLPVPLFGICAVSRAEGSASGTSSGAAAAAAVETHTVAEQERRWVDDLWCVLTMVSPSATATATATAETTFELHNQKRSRLDIFSEPHRLEPLPGMSISIRSIVEIRVEHIEDTKSSQMAMPSARTPKRRGRGDGALSAWTLLLRFVPECDACACYLPDEELISRGVVELRLRPSGSMSLTDAEVQCRRTATWSSHIRAEMERERDRELEQQRQQLASKQPDWMTALLASTVQHDDIVRMFVECFDIERWYQLERSSQEKGDIMRWCSRLVAPVSHAHTLSPAMKSGARAWLGRSRGDARPPRPTVIEQLGECITKCNLHNEATLLMRIVASFHAEVETHAMHLFGRVSGDANAVADLGVPCGCCFCTATREHAKNYLRFRQPPLPPFGGSETEDNSPIRIFSLSALTAGTGGKNTDVIFESGDDADELD